MAEDADDRIKTAYDTFRHGITAKDIPLPWGHLLPWIRDAMRVAYLQGRLDKGRDESRDDSKPTGGAQLVGVAAVAEPTPEKLSQRPFEDDPLHATLDAQIEKLTREKIELWGALSKAIDYCDAATHPDQQYADDRPNLLRVMEECQ